MPQHSWVIHEVSELGIKSEFVIEDQMGYQKEFKPDFIINNMSEELLQRDLLKSPEKIGEWEFYNIGSTTINSLKRNKKIKDIAE